MENKNNYLKILLKNPKSETASIIVDGWNAPLGSTKRSKARTILKMLRNREKDGRGGTNAALSVPPAGQFNFTPNMTPGQNMTPGKYDFSSISLPSGQNNFSGLFSGNVSSPIMDSYSTLNAQSLMSTPSLPLVLKPAPSDSLSTLSPSIYGRPSAVAPSIVGSASSLSGWGNLSKAAFPTVQGGTLVYKNKVTSGRGLTGVTAGTEGPDVLYIPAGGLIPPGYSKTRVGAGLSAVKPLPATPTTEPTPTGPVAPAATDQYGAPIGPEQAPEGYTAPAEPTFPWMNLLEQMDVTKPAAAQVFETMADTEQKKALFPYASPEVLNAATLSGAVDQLANKLKESTGLNDLVRQKTNLVNAGNYLMADLDDYIRGKDTYVKEVDTMIDDVKNKLLTGGISTDPQTLKGTDDYLNLLYLLKGQQNKRYMDLVNSASEKYNADMASLDNTITMASAEFQERLASGVPILQEEYNQMLSTISSFLSSYQSGIDASGWPTATMFAAGNAASGAVEGSKATDITGIFADLAPFFMVPVPGKANEMIFHPVGLPAKIQSAITYGNHQPKLVFLFLMKQIESAGYSGNLAMIEQIKDALVELSGQKEMDANGNVWTYGDKIFGAPGKIDELNMALKNTIRKPISSYIRSEIEKIRPMIADLVKLNNADEIAAWKADNSIPGDASRSVILNALAAAYQLSLQRNPDKPNITFVGNKKVRKLTDEELINIITGAISESWVSESTNKQ